MASRPILTHDNSQFVILLLCACFPIPSLSSKTTAPNIVFILADDLGWDDVGFHGSEIKTPNIDRLAGEGVILNNYYVQPICTPTRSAILSGRYPIHTGLQHYVIVGSQPYGLPLNVTTLPQQLKNLGYKTHAVGKWHLGFCSDAYIPENRGFDSFLGYYTGHSDYLDHYTHDGGFMGYDLHLNKSTLWNQTEVYSTELFTARAKSIIHSHDKASPLFMYVAHQAVHAGNFDVLQAPQKYVDRFGYITNLRRKLFAGMVSALDDSVGDIYQALVDAGLADNTIIVFSTDNGGPTNGYDQNAACNWPLRGCKGTLWQGGVRGVGFIHSPILEKKAYVNEKMMHVTDWFPTLLSAASSNHSSKSPPNRPEYDIQKLVQNLDGFDQWAVINQDIETKRREVLLNIDPIDDHEAIIMGDFKLIYGEMAGGGYNGWYPPPSHEANTFLSSQGYKKQEIQSHGRPDAEKVPGNSNLETDDLIALMNKQYKELKRDLYSDSQKKDSQTLFFSPEKNVHTSNVVRVDCGPKPANASTNCIPKNEACLFNIKDDPCEYMNLAQQMPALVQMLLLRLETLKSGMVPPANKPIDPRGDPQLNGGVWKPWL